MARRQRKIRAEFRKNRTVRTRRTDWTEQFHQDELGEDGPSRTERISGKGELARRRTVTGQSVSGDDGSTFGVRLDVDEAGCLAGRVLSVRGLANVIQAEDGTIYRCATRRLLKTLSTNQRHVVVVGDRVLFRPVPGASQNEGVIERVEPRRGCISRTSGGRQHVLVANVQQVLLVVSVAQPRLKRELIDRVLVSAEKGRAEPILCINKIDLVDPVSLMPLAGIYSQMGYRVLLLSAATGFGLSRMRQSLAGRQSVIVGQSGVGKSSLLNAIDPSLHLRVQPVSEDNEKGKHTTTTAQLLPLAGGYVVDTPGIRQFQLWEVIPAEVAGFYRDLRPYVSQCHFPDCTHTHEADCAVKDAVADGRLDERRYESYCHLLAGDAD